MGWGLPLFEISQGIPILRYQKTSKMAVSFSFSAYFPNTEILETRINPRFFALVLGQGFIFVQPSHQTESGRNSRSGLSFLFCLFARVYSGYLFCQYFSGVAPQTSREFHFCGVRDFSCPRFYWLCSLRFAKNALHVCEVRFFFAYFSPNKNPNRTPTGAGSDFFC